MTVQIEHESPSALREYARVSIAFNVCETFEVSAPAAGLEGIILRARPEPAPYVKDYDRAPGSHPTEWPRRFDMHAWAIFAAWEAEARVGGAVVAWDTPGVDMLEGRGDLAVLWDLRVAPGARGRGIGAMLFRAAEAWATARGARCLKVETQNVNVGAVPTEWRGAHRGRQPFAVLRQPPGKRVVTPHTDWPYNISPEPSRP